METLQQFGILSIFTFIAIFVGEFTIDNRNPPLQTNTILISATEFAPDTSQENPAAFGDTIDIIADGVDTLYVLYIDTSSNENDSASERLINTSDMIITLGDEELPVEAGIFGIHLENYFMQGIANKTGMPLSEHLLLYETSFEPDSIPDYQFGDTFDMYIDGVDTIYYLYIDESANDSAYTEERLMSSGDIIITLNNEQFPVEYGIYGDLLISEQYSENSVVDISMLPVGTYTVLIKTEGFQTEAKSLIKMK